MTKVTVKTFKCYFYSNKCCSFELSIHLWILKIKCITVSTKILCSTTVSTLIIIRHVSWAANHAYYYDFWRSCDTEDCSNDAENTALITEINYSLTHIHIEKQLFYITIIFLNIAVFRPTVFLISWKDFFLLNGFMSIKLIPSI